MNITFLKTLVRLNTDNNTLSGLNASTNVELIGV